MLSVTMDLASRAIPAPNPYAPGSCGEAWSPVRHGPRIGARRAESIRDGKALLLMRFRTVSFALIIVGIATAAVRRKRRRQSRRNVTIASPVPPLPPARISEHRVAREVNTLGESWIRFITQEWEQHEYG